MATVVRRDFVSSPARDALDTWTAIVDILTVENVHYREELESVTGIAASVIADRGPAQSPIVITCAGPRTRIYCLYDDAAIDGTAANEDLLGFNPLNGDWNVSLPCLPEDLEWVQTALASHTTRVVARDVNVTVEVESVPPNDNRQLTINPTKLLD